MNTRFVAVALIALAACSKTHVAERTGSDSHAVEAPAEPTLLPAGGPSLYAVTSDLVDQNGKRIALSDFRGDPLIVSMFYSGCPYACPMLINKIQGAESKLDDATRKRVRVLMVSFDSEHDTPQVLQQVAAQHHVDASRWHLAHASEADVRTLAAVLDIKYQKLPEGGFSHSSVITVLDAGGVARFRQDDLNAPPDPIARAIALVGAPARTAFR